MTPDIVFYLRREAQSVIDCGVGDGWPLWQAADEIERLRAAIAFLVNNNLVDWWHGGVYLGPLDERRHAPDVVAVVSAVLDCTPTPEPPQ